ncbi:MAG: type IV secretion system protein [Pseudoxanthomonas sp.]
MRHRYRREEIAGGEMNLCPAIPGGDSASLSNTLAAIDCQLNGAVAAGYGRLFGHGGVFIGVLTAVLTLYVALLALGLVTGRTRLTLSAAMPKVLALGLVLTFASAWPAYQTVVYDLLARGPDQIASAFVGRGSGATRIFVLRLDEMFGRWLELAQALQSQGEQASPNLKLAAKLAWAGSLLLVLSTAGLLVMARAVLAILLALGPVFIVFALFRGTRGLFEGWLKTTLAFALTPMLIALGGAGAIALISPLLDEVAQDPLAAGEALQPVAMLFLAALIYAGTLLALLWTAISLTRGWRLSRGHDAEPEVAPSIVSKTGDERAISPLALATNAHAAREATAAGDAATRLAAVSVALSRSDATQALRAAPVTVNVNTRGDGARDSTGALRRGQLQSRWERKHGNTVQALQRRPTQ